MATDDLGQFAKTIAQLQASTDLAGEQAATSIAQLGVVIRNENQTVGEFATEFGNVVVELGNNFATTESKIVDFSQRIAGAGKEAGLTGDELAGISAAVLQTGTNVEAGGSAIQRTLEEITTAVDIGGDELQGFADVAGKSAEDFSEIWRTDASKGFQLFIEGLGDAGPEASTILDDLGLSSLRTRSTLKKLAGSGGELERALSSASAEIENQSALTDEAARRQATFSEVTANVKDQLSNLGDSIGQVVLPKLQAIAEWFQANPAAIKIAAIVIAGLAAAFIALGIAAGIATLALIPISLPILALVAVIAAVVAAIFLFKDEIMIAWNFIKNLTVTVFTAVFNFLKAHWDKLLVVFTLGASLIVGYVIRNWNKILSVTIAIFNSIKNAVSSAINTIRSVVSAGINAIVFIFVGLPNRIGGALASLAATLFNTFVNAMNRANAAITSGIFTVLSFFRSLPGKIIGALGNLGTLLYQAGKDIVLGLLNGLKDGAAAVLDYAGSLAGSIKDKFAGALQIFSPSRVFFGFGENIVEGLANGLQNAAGLAIEAAETLAEELANKEFNVSPEVTPVIGSVPSISPAIDPITGRGCHFPIRNINRTKHNSSN